MKKREVEMHIVEVTGGNRTQRQVAENVVYYMIKKLMPRLRNIEIEVKLKKLTDDDAVGYCMMLDNRRDYLIEASKDLTIKDFVMTLCHEMVHVKQYVRKEMDDWNGVAVARWKGGTVLPNTSYYDLPWEKKHTGYKQNLRKNVGTKIF